MIGHTIQDEFPTSPRARDVLYFFSAEGGFPSEAAGVVARTEVGLAVLYAWRTALFDGLLPHRLKEMVRLRLSRPGTACSAQGRRDGLTDEFVVTITSTRENTALTEAEKVALWYADRFRDDDVDDDEVFSVLRSQFSDEEIIELGKFCALVLGVERFLISLTG